MMRSTYSSIDGGRARSRRGLAIAVVGLVAALGLLGDAHTRRRVATALYSPRVTVEEYMTDLLSCSDYDDDTTVTWECDDADWSAWCMKDHLVGNTSKMTEATTFYK